MTSILGISAFYHDSAAAIIIDGNIIAAAQEERFSRKKHDPRYPFHAVKYVLEESNLSLNEVDHIVFFEKPFLKFERLLETYVAFAPKGFGSFCKAMPIWLKDKLFQKKLLINELKKHDNEFNDPEKFTTLIGWEWSSLPMGVNLHRVIISPDGGDIAKSYIPFGSDQSQYPQKLWEWLEDTSNKTGAEFIAIPHNSNISKGYMFDRTTLEGDQITASYAKTRLAWEPIVEVTQIKGDSETHSKLSPNDDFADFENYEYHIQVGKSKYIPQEADFVRPALKVGLEIEKSVGVNPYKFGLIGSTDSHSGLSSPEESNFLGKFATDSTPETKKRLGSRLSANGWDMSASGLAAVWAENNTRDEIFNAFKRREVYATTGSRIKVQVFAGWLFPEGAENANNFSEIGYKYGVPMGGELASASDLQASLSLLIRAAKDPKGANLDRIQVVKGWIDKENQTRERVFDVAWSEDRVNLENDRIAPIQSTVDLTSGRYENSVGEDSFAVLWTDPDFTPADKSFYYVRVLEIPTPRNGLLDSIALGLNKPPRGASIIQERAYSSPIWYHPK